VFVKPRGLTLVEVLIALVILTILLVIVLPALVQSRERSLRQACRTNLKTIAIAIKMYAQDDPNYRWPPVAYLPRHGNPGTPGNWNIDGSFSPCARCLYPNYLKDVSVWICPADYAARREEMSAYLESWVDANGNVNIERLEREADVSYQYLGWAIWSSAYLHDGHGDSTEVLSAIEKALNYAATYTDTATFPPEQDIVFPNGHPNPDARSQTLPRFREGLDRVYVTDTSSFDLPPAQSEIAVMWDRVPPDLARFNHSPQGSNVLFADGHVEFVQYPGEFPMSDLFAKVAALRKANP